MSTSLPARPSLEQLKKLAKDLVKAHEEKQPEALALIARHLPALAGKSALEIAAHPFALHDAQSVVARQYGFASWNEISGHVEAQNRSGSAAPVPDLDVAGKLRTVILSRERNDYALFCSVMSREMIAFIDKERFEATNERMSVYLKPGHQLTYMGALKRSGRLVHFWRLWNEGWESDLLIRMALNAAGEISGLLYSDPFDTGINKKS